MPERDSRAIGQATEAARPTVESADAIATCDVCGVAAVVERKCKVICLNCHTILKTCADL
jgi:uncharacterized membrane protein